MYIFSIKTLITYKFNDTTKEKVESMIKNARFGPETMVAERILTPVAEWPAKTSALGP